MAIETEVKLTPEELVMLNGLVVGHHLVMREQTKDVVHLQVLVNLQEKLIVALSNVIERIKEKANG